MKKCSLVKKGFIDPRRGDVVRFNFTLDCELLHDGNVIADDKVVYGYIIAERLITKFPFIHNFKCRESWVEIDGTKNVSHSGHGPEPEYPAPDGECCEIVFELGDLKLS